MAAQVAVTTSLVDPREDFAINLRGTLNVLEALRTRAPAHAADLRLHQQGLWRPRRHRLDAGEATPIAPIDSELRAHGVGEARPLDFHTPYGCSKGAADQYVLDYARSFGLPTAVLRMSCIYGPRQMGTEDQGWVAHFLIRALEGEPITHLWRRLSGARHPRRRRTRSTAYLAAGARIDAVPGRAFNLGGGPEQRGQPAPAAGAYRGAARPPGRCRLSRTGAPATSATSSPTRARRTRRSGSAATGRLARRVVGAALARWLAEARGHDASAIAAPTEAAADAAGHAPCILMTADAVGGVWHYALNWRRHSPACGHRDDPRRARAAAIGRAAQARSLARNGVELVDTGRRSTGWRPMRPRCGRPASPLLGSRARAGRHRPAQPARARRRRAFPVPVVVVAHSCVATWWEAVRGARLPADSTGGPRSPRAGWRGADAVVAPQPGLRRDARRAAMALPRRRRGPQRPHAARSAGAPRSDDFAFTAGRLWDEGKNVAALDRAAARLGVPFQAAGPLDGPNGAARGAGALPSARRRSTSGRWPAALSARRSSSRRPSTSRSAWRCWRRRRPAARWSSPTSRPSANCGTARRCSSPPATRRARADVDRLVERSCRPAARGDRAPGRRAGALHPATGWRAA